MNVIWIILAVLAFVGAQVYLFLRLRKVDKFLDKGPYSEPALPGDDSCRYPDEDVVE